MSAIPNRVWSWNHGERKGRTTSLTMARQKRSSSSSATALVSPVMVLWIWLSLLLLLEQSSAVPTSTPTPTPWPHQFHSILFANYSGSLSLIDLWYDWPNGRNFNIVQNQLGKLLYDLEWNNGTSFFYNLDPSHQECRSVQLEVGILRPNWLDGATYLGQRRVDGFLCNVWEKVDFIWYYEDVATKRPVHWLFYTGRSIHVMTFEVGAVLEDSGWQAPVYCFQKKDGKNETGRSVLDADILERRVDGGLFAKGRSRC